ncbi:ABC-F family ATP-binding cassette domain-containing protein [Anaeromyxobacter diazotrophicus]|uniref:Glycosyl transferase family 1 n=1 Tax=Anaeromyxobacter diazotrophicus TaxID=2590199 RepID=A0A7I9VSG0_9BACT|nr:ABC-F family ATP-binding cassette domain-containing protein [Anaeromyxobacter diazotrophicus]GEJ59019.1 glycosyl transferase family 1 [Anaeromyxobacter diazotrophicus]
MSLLTASGLALAYGPKVLLHEAGFAIGPRDRIGLVGANGTGKSSLLRILAGEISPDAGTLAWRRGGRAGYLPQDVAALPSGPLVEVVLASVPGRGAVEAQLAATEAALREERQPEEQLELSQALADLHAELDHFEERFGRHRAERILTGLGFAPAELERDSAALSGGWKMRAALAGLLLQDPDLLLLDEPTNHLDIPTLTWFDAFLRGSQKALLLISHDREFLNRQIGRVLALEPEGLRGYAGNYDDYRRLRAEEEERLGAAARRQEARRAELQGFIDRFGAKATKARQAQSRQKMLDKMEEVQVLEERATLSFRFAEAPRSGKEVVRLEGVAKAFGDRIVYRGLSGQVLRGERVGIIGPNGAGKTTLLRLVAGELAADAGEVKLGHSVVPGYYAQHHFEAAPGDASRGFGALDPRKTILDTLWDVVPDQGEAYVRGVAGGFLFSGSDVEKPIGVLSGGERARVALARILLLRSNLLLLDEPTNHLDLTSSEALIEALRGYDGTMLFVSHNRSFLNGLATRIWEVKDGAILDQPGNLDDWLYHQRQLEEQRAEGPARGAEARLDAKAAPVNDRDRRRLEAEARNARYARERPLRQAIAALERRIAELEAAQKTAEAALADPALYQDFARARPHVEALAAAKDELAALYADWEAKQVELESLAG